MAHIGSGQNPNLSLEVEKLPIIPMIDVIGIILKALADALRVSNSSGFSKTAWNAQLSLKYKK